MLTLVLAAVMAGWGSGRGHGGGRGTDQRPRDTCGRSGVSGIARSKRTTRTQAPRQLP